MIRLIATDLDGTLLDDQHQLPADFEELWNLLHAHNIILLAATGRDYNGAAGFFGPLAEKMVFITDNGANIYHQGKVIRQHHIPRDRVHAMLDEIEKIENADPMLCGTKGTYATKGSAVFMKKMANHYSPVTWVEDLYSIEDDIFKVSVYDATGDIRNHSYLRLAEQFAEENTVHISANVWVDMMDKRADKGLALQHLQELFGIRYEETMAFGDFYNDEPLLKHANYAFVVENAPEDLKERYKNHAPSNREAGVTKIIREWVTDRL